MRPGITWVIAGAVAVIVVFAGLDALRSSGSEPPPAAGSATGVTTTRTDTDVEVESSSELREGIMVELEPGRVTARQFFEMVVTFTVPEGWYGYQGPGVLVLGKGLAPAAVGVNLASGGIVVQLVLSRLLTRPRALRRRRAYAFTTCLRFVSAATPVVGTASC